MLEFHKKKIPIVTLNGIIVVLINVGMIASIGSQYLLVRIIYTLITICYGIYVFYKIYTNIWFIYNDNTANLKDLIDLITSYFIIASLLLLLFWIWGETNFFTNFGRRDDINVFVAFERCMIISLLGSGIGIGNYQPTRIESEIAIALISYIGYILTRILLAVVASFFVRQNQEEQNDSYTNIEIRQANVDLKLE